MMEKEVEKELVKTKAEILSLLTEILPEESSEASHIARDRSPVRNEAESSVLEGAMGNERAVLSVAVSAASEAPLQGMTANPLATAESSSETSKPSDVTPDPVGPADSARSETVETSDATRTETEQRCDSTAESVEPQGGGRSEPPQSRGSEMESVEPAGESKAGDPRGGDTTREDAAGAERAGESSGESGPETEEKYERTLNLNSEPRLVAVAKEEFSKQRNNYLRGCKWSPDGSCLLTNSRDNVLRIYNLPEAPPEGTDPVEMTSAVRMPEPDLVYDFCWFPGMHSGLPAFCCLLTTSRRHSIHLRDAYSGEVRCVYKPMNHLDELEAAFSLAFSSDGASFYAGFRNGIIRVFDVARPNQASQRRPRLGVKSVLRGIVSCVCAAPGGQLYAAGCYNRAVALFAEPGTLVAQLRGQMGGVTQLAFSPDGRLLFSGGRKDPEILAWDLRMPGVILFALRRHVATNQRVYFDISGSANRLISGNHSGRVSLYDLGLGEPYDRPPVLSWSAHEDSCNGISLNHVAGLLATASGQRTLPTPYFLKEPDSDSSGSEMEAERKEENCLKLWHYA